MTFHFLMSAEEAEEISDALYVITAAEVHIYLQV